jgi:uncharacterized membrane protein
MKSHTLCPNKCSAQLEFTSRRMQSAHSQAYGVLYQTLQQQAGLWAYVEQFRFLALICLVLVPIIFLFK